MERLEFINKVNQKLKLVRTEYGYSQEKMAGILGISKKTLIQVEKGRASLGWPGAVALCSLFYNSEIIAATFGGRPTDIIMALAFEGNEPAYPKTMGGRIWWKTLEAYGKYKIQQNIISQHYRLLDAEDRRIASSFQLEHMIGKIKELNGGEENGTGR